MKRELTYQKSLGLKGGPNHLEISMTGYRADSPDRFRNHNVIPTGHISMANVPHPVMGIDDMGNRQMMMPGQEYMFPGSQVLEIPMRNFQSGGPMPGEPGGEPKPDPNQATMDWLNSNPYMRNDKPLSMKDLKPRDVTGYPRMTGQNIFIPGAGNFGPDQYQQVTMPEGYAGHPVYLVNGKPVVVDKKFNQEFFNMYEDPKFLGKDELFPIYGRGLPYQQFGGPNPMMPDFGKMFKDVAKEQVKSFGTKSQAPQNMTTDNMIEYKNKSFANKIAQNNFRAMAMQEADAMANMMNQAFMPMAQFGMNVQSYDANRSNAGAYFDAYNTLKNQSREDFNNFLGESGEMVQSIYNNPAQMKLAKVRTRITDPTVKDQYGQYKKDMKTGMTPNEPADPWEAFNQNVQTMKDKKQPISMNDMGPIPMGFGYTPQGMVFMVGGPVPEFQTGGIQPAYVNPFGAIVPGANLMDMRGVPNNGNGNNAANGNPAYSGNYQYNFNRQPVIVPGLHTSDPQGGIGQSMYNSGFYDVYDGSGRQFWVQNPVQARQVALDAQRNAEGSTPPVVPKKGTGTTPTVPKKGTGTGGNGNAGSESTEEIKDFTHQDVTASGNAGSTTAGTERRGNVTDEPGASSSTTGTTAGTQQGAGFFVTQPGYYGQQGVGYNLFPSNMRWQRGPGMNVGPAVAYNPMDTYLDEYDYKGRFLGKGPRRVKMSFSHYGKPGMPGMPQQGLVSDQAPADTRQQNLDIISEGMKPSPNAKEVLGVDMSQSVFNPENPNSIIWNSGNQPTMAMGGPFAAAAPYPGAVPFHAYTAFFQPGGETEAGSPNAGDNPWAQTEAVWKRQMAGNSQDWADWGLAGMSMLSSIGETGERRAMEEQMKQRMVGDAVFNPYGAGDASRGTWTVNRGDFRPDQHTPVQFQGWNQGMVGSPMTQGKYGGSFQQGGEYYLSDDEIQQIMAMGGQVEFLD